MEQGKTVFAVPGRVDDALSEGCNLLIADGAGIANSVESILSELQILPEKKGISSINQRYGLQAMKKWCIVVWIYSLKI